GTEGDDVWGTRAKWVNLTGTVDGESVTVTLFDHPKNVGYPTYWHARGYGLYAANPMAPSVFSGGKAAALNYTLPAGQSVTFRYRIAITSGAVSASQTARQAEQFDGGK
ncbi:MAG: PmoA family protein, partial [Bacteroidetes bacterium]|nr:PmoA family protein [Fibrella sp.]